MKDSSVQNPSRGRGTEQKLHRPMSAPVDPPRVDIRNLFFVQETNDIVKLLRFLDRQLILRAPPMPQIIIRLVIQGHGTG